MKSKTYDILKRVCLVVLPATASLYAAVSSIWNLGNTTEIVGTITSIDTFLGVILGISSSKYKGEVSASAGAFVVSDEQETMTLRADTTTILQNKGRHVKFDVIES